MAASLSRLSAGKNGRCFAGGREAGRLYIPIRHRSYHSPSDLGRASILAGNIEKEKCMEQSKHSISSKDEVSPTWSRKRFPLFLYFFFENAALRVRQRDPDRLSPNKRFSVLHVVSRTQTTDSKAHTTLRTRANFFPLQY